MVSARPDDATVLQAIAILSAVQGRPQDYQEACRAMCRQFQSDVDIDRKELVISTVIACPGSLSDYGDVLTMCDDIVRAMRNERFPERANIRSGLKGLVLFRAGRYEEALPILSTAHSLAINYSPVAELEFFLAMTCRQLSRDDEAKDWLRLAQQSAQREVTGSSALESQLSWLSEAKLRLLEREATSLIDPTGLRSTETSSVP
jgi:tetratricopeptide (TPR) repeat protein